MALAPILARRSVCVLVTTGRVSGRPRSVELWFAADPVRDRIYILAGGRDEANWIRNVKAEPAVLVRFGDRVMSGRAEVIEAGPDDPLARRLLLEKYEGDRPGSLDAWGRDSLPVAIDLAPPD